MTPVERGGRLKELREAAGFKQRQVGAWFDIDGRAVSEWERGKSNPDRRKLVRLDESYGANGEVLAMFDVAPLTLRSDEAEELRAELAELRGLLAAVAESDAAKGARIERLSDQLDRLTRGRTAKRS